MGINIARVFVEIGTKTKGFDQGTSAIEKRLSRLSSKLNKAGVGMTASLTAPIAAIGGLSLKAASDFETAFANVRKTVNATTEEYESLAKGIRDMSQQMPVSAEEIAKVVEEAGRLGIKKENLLGFADNMIRLAETSTLASDEAATALAKLANITKMPQENFDRLASTITVLGSTFETNETDITEFALRIAKTGSQVGLTEAQIVAFATALSAVGINAEAGGTAISRVMGEMALDVDTGAKRLEVWAAISRKSIADFSRDFREHAAGAIQDFMRGLGNLEGTGVSALQVLKAMNFENIRVRDAFLGLANSTEHLDEILKTANQAWNENSAIVELSNRRFETTGAQTTILTNQLKEQQRQLGEAMIPVYREFLGLMKDKIVPVITAIVDWFGNLDSETKTTILTLGALVAIGGPVLLFLGQFAAVLTLIAAHPIVAMIAGLGLVVTAFAAVSSASSDAKSSIQDVADAMDNNSAAAVRFWEDQVRSAEELAAASSDWTEEQKRAHVEAAKAVLVTKKLLLAEEQRRKGLEQAEGPVKRHEKLLAEIIKRTQLLGDREARLREELALTKQTFQEMAAVVPATDETLIGYRDRIIELEEALRNLQASQTEEWSEQAKANIQEVVEGWDQGHLTMEERVKQFEQSNQEAWDNWMARGQAVSTQMSAAFLDLYQGMSQGFGDVVAEMAVEGTSFTKLMDRLWKSLASQIISSLVAIGIQWLLTTILGKTASASQHIGRMGQLAAQTFGGAFAATAAIPIVGPFIAPGVAAGALAAMLIGSAGAFGAGAALGAGQAVFHQGGMPTTDGWAIIQRNEVVLTPDQVKQLGRGETIAIFEFDAEAFAKAIIPKMPGVYRRKMGGSI